MSDADLPGRAAHAGSLGSGASVVPPTAAASTAHAADEPRRRVLVTPSRRGPRRARLVIKHIDPWTVMKVSFVVSLVMLVVGVVAVSVIYAVLGKMGVWDSINNFVDEISPTTTKASLHNPLTGSRIIGITAIVGAINVVLLTAVATLGAAIYNLISDLVGGVEVTLTDP